MGLTDKEIHDELALYAEDMANEALQEYRRKRKLRPICVTWPGEVIKTDSGAETDKPVTCFLDTVSEAHRAEVLRKLTERTKAFGLVLIEERADDIRVVFETRLGTRAWITPLKFHGDVRVPGKTHASTNRECVGLLWKPALSS